jgi:hypothetical protein
VQIHLHSGNGITKFERRAILPTRRTPFIVALHHRRRGLFCWPVARTTQPPVTDNYNQSETSAVLAVR